MSAYSVICSPCSTLQLDQSLIFIARLTSQTLLSVSTGYMLPRELSSNWQSLSTEQLTGLCLGTCLISCAMLLTCRLGVVFGHQLPTNLLSVHRPSCLVTVGEQSFASAGRKNSLLGDITSLTVFRRKLKTNLFQQSYPDIIM